MTMRALWWQLLLVVFALGLYDAAEAQTYIAQFPPNPGVMPGGGWQYTTGTTFGDPPGPRAWVNGKYGGIPQFKATDLYRLPGPSGTIPVSVVSAAGLGGAAAAVGRCVVGLNPICAAGTAAWMVYDKYRARPVTGVNEQVCGGVPCTFPSGQFDWDMGTAPSGASAPVATTTFVGTYAPTGDAACTSMTCFCDAYKVGYNLNQGGADIVSYTISGDVCVLRLDNNGDIYKTASRGTKMVSQPGGCPASVDAFNPAYSIPAGSPIGPDGKCPTARYNHIPRTPEQMADLVNEFPPELPNVDWGRAVSDAIDLGGQKAPASLTGSGPASQTGTPKVETTNNPDGTTGRKTTTPTTNYTFNNSTTNYPSITYATTNNYTTQTCTGGGSCTTTGGGSTPGPTSEEPKQDPEDPCVKSPTMLSCMKVGEAGPKETIPTENLPATYTPTVFAAPGGCPAAIPFSVFGKAFSLGYEPMCNTLATIRLIFLAIGALAAAWIFQEGFFKL